MPPTDEKTWMKTKAILASAALSALTFVSVFARTVCNTQSFAPALYYKTNCAECHGKDADKKFEPVLPESQLVDAILNGEKMETPPDMPAFADKGINEERAKALVTYMKSFRE